MKAYKGCKIYSQYGSRFGTWVAIITAVFLFLLIIPMIVLMIINYEDSLLLGTILFVVVMLLGCVVLLVVCSVQSYKGYKRALEIKQGIKTKGTVDRFIYVAGKAPYYQLFYSYTNDNNEKCYTRTNVDCKWGINILSKTVVPIYVKGEFSILDIDEVKVLAPTYTYDKSVMKACPLCGNMLKGNKRYCSSCHNSV